jgi:hypothetical protein
MVTLARLVLGTLRHLFDSRGDLALENLGLAATARDVCHQPTEHIESVKKTRNPSLT